MQLRPYQQEAFDAVYREFDRGVKRTIVSMATGCGKTNLAAHIAKHWQAGRVMFCAHRDELISQAWKTFARETGETPDVEQGAENYANESSIYGRSQFVIASIQSLHDKRLTPDRFNDIGLLIIDEAHRASQASKLWGRLTDILRDKNPALRTLGLSVGPDANVVLRGGPFASGFFGKIERVFDILAKSFPVLRHSDYEVILLSGSGVQTRGWDGNEFRWKDMKSAIRHRCTTTCTELRTSSGHLLMTDCHSVYVLDDGDCRRKKRKREARPIAEIRTKETCSVTVDDMLISDDGANWDSPPHELIDGVALGSASRSASKIRVAVDLSGISTARMIEWGITDHRIRWSYRHPRGPHGSSLPIHLFVERRHELPEPTRVYWEGAHGHYIEPAIPLDNNWAYMLGFFLGDGWIASDGRIGFAVENRFSESLYKDFSQLPGIKWNLTVKPGHGKSVELRGHNLLVTEFLLREFGGQAKCHEKEIPARWIVSWPESARRSLLNGLTDSDGHVSKNKGLRHFTTTSRPLADSLIALLMSLGVRAGLSPRKMSLGGCVNGRQIQAGRQAYSVVWSAHAEYGDHERRNGHRRRYNHGDMKLIESPVRESRPREYAGYVYDFSLEGHPSFTANGVLVHNTATPVRADRMPILFDTCAYEYGLRAAINDGYLVRPQSQIVVVEGLDFSKIRMGKKDFNQEDLTHALEQEGPLHEIASVTVSETGDLKTLVFAASVRQAQELSAIINRYKPGSSDWLCGDQNLCPKQTRREILKRFSDGELQYVVSVLALSEGYDEPTVQCLVMARPTRSPVLASQTLGRGTRTYPGVLDGVDYATPEERLAAIAASIKPHVRVLDFVDQSRNPIVTACDPEILGGEYNAEECAQAKKQIQENTAAGEMSDIDVELAKARRLLEQQEEERRQKAREMLVGSASYTLVDIDPLSASSAGATRRVERPFGKPVTERQAAKLREYGFNPNLYNRKQAQGITNQIHLGKIRKPKKTPAQAANHKPATERQKRALAHYGLETNVTEAEASKLIVRENARRKAVGESVASYTAKQASMPKKVAGPATAQQQMLLKRFGFPTNVGYTEAAAIIAERINPKIRQKIAERA